MKTDDFDFDLPEDRIALRPAEARDASRLLHVRQDGLADLAFGEIEEALREGDVLVINDTKVIPAALHGFRPARAEGGGGDVAVDANLLSPLAEPGGWR
jgi:S-adenosylmethionine:tRNA ribosyltransferase-isomerase